MNKNDDKLDLFMFSLSSILSLGILFLFINESRRKKNIDALSEDEEKKLYIIIRISYFFVTLYFLIDAYNRLKYLKETTANEEDYKQQLYQFSSAICLFIAAIINLKVLNPNIIKFT